MKSKRKSPLKRVGTFFVVALLLFGTFLPGVFPWESGAEGEQAVTVEDTVDKEESTFIEETAEMLPDESSQQESDKNDDEEVKEEKEAEVEAENILLEETEHIETKSLSLAVNDSEPVSSRTVPVTIEYGEELPFAPSIEIWLKNKSRPGEELKQFVDNLGTSTAFIIPEEHKDDDFELSIQAGEGFVADFSGHTSGGYNVKIYFDSQRAVVDIKGTIVWRGGPEAVEELKLELWGKDGPVGETETLQIHQQSAGSIFTIIHRWENIPVKNSDGTRQQFCIRLAEEVENYTVSYPADTTINMEYTSPTETPSGVLNWEGGIYDKNKNPADQLPGYDSLGITFLLTRDKENEKLGHNFGDTLTAHLDSEGRFSWGDIKVPLKDFSGRPYVYTVTQKTKKGNTQLAELGYQMTEEVVATGNDLQFTFTNYYQESAVKRTVPVTIEYGEELLFAPSIEIGLKNKSRPGEELKQFVENLDTSTAFIIPDEQKDDTFELIVQRHNDFTLRILGDDQTGFTVKVGSRFGNVPVEIQWKGTIPAEKPVLYLRLADEAEMFLEEECEYGTAHLRFENVYLYDTSGNKMELTFNAEVMHTNTVNAGDYRITIEGNPFEGFKLIVTFEPVDSLVDIKGAFMWSGGPAIREDLKVQMYQNDEPLGEVTTVKVPANPAGATFPFEHTWENLPSRGEDGSHNFYRIEIVEVPENFKVHYSGDVAMKISYVPPETTFSGQLTWKGGLYDREKNPNAPVPNYDDLGLTFLLTRDRDLKDDLNYVFGDLLVVRPDSTGNITWPAVHAPLTDFSGKPYVYFVVQTVEKGNTKLADLGYQMMGKTTMVLTQNGYVASIKNGNEDTLPELEAVNPPPPNTPININKGLEIRFKGDYENLTAVKFNGITLVQTPIDENTAILSGYKNYQGRVGTVRKGSSIVTLDPTFLASLSVGEQKVEMNFSYDGVTGSAVVPFIAKKAEETPAKKPSDIPNAGDTSNIALWLMIAVAALIVAVGAFVFYKKRKK
ncbi:MAG: Cna B-type domain-containing protein [Clostridiales bacterium]|nr:Cna B-type domain-containing protein [Clostridiales bacterium]